MGCCLSKQADENDGSAVMAQPNALAVAPNNNKPVLDGKVAGPNDGFASTTLDVSDVQLPPPVDELTFPPPPPPQIQADFDQTVQTIPMAETDLRTADNINDPSVQLTCTPCPSIPDTDPTVKRALLAEKLQGPIPVIKVPQERRSTAIEERRSMQAPPNVTSASNFLSPPMPPSDARNEMLASDADTTVSREVSVQSDFATVATFNPEVKVAVLDMPCEQLDQIVGLCRNTLATYGSSEVDIAREIKRLLDKTFGPVWMVIVGKSFGTFVTYEQCRFAHLYFDDIAIVIFKVVSTINARQ